MAAGARENGGRRLGRTMKGVPLGASTMPVLRIQQRAASCNCAHHLRTKRRHKRMASADPRQTTPSLGRQEWGLWRGAPRCSKHRMLLAASRVCENPLEGWTTTKYSLTSFHARISTFYLYFRLIHPISALIASYLYNTRSDTDDGTEMRGRRVERRRMYAPYIWGCVP